jgi:hypothetical protein
MSFSASIACPFALKRVLDSKRAQPRIKVGPLPPAKRRSTTPRIRATTAFLRATARGQSGWRAVMWKP